MSVVLNLTAILGVMRKRFSEWYSLMPGREIARRFLECVPLPGSRPA